jgi:phage terminase large subunit
MAQTITVTPNYKPNPKQIMLHNAPVSYDDIWIICYGGARGGGKSAGILADAFLFCQTYPGAKCCILRETLDAVKQSFLDKLPTLFPQEVNGIKIYEYREKSSSWYPSRSIVFPNGSYITLQRVANYAEARTKQGWEFHYLAIDEVTKQEERTVDYLLTCVRSATVINKYTNKPLQIPTKVVFGCNPGGIGHKWVKERFVDKTVVKYDEHNTPIQTKDYVERVENPQKKGSYINRFIRFIPASFRDNPFLNASYVANLDQLPEHLKQLDMYGNWNTVAGKYFDLKPEQILEPALIAEDLQNLEGHVEIFISIDWGYKPSYHSAHWYAVFPDHRVICFKELYGQELVFEDFVKTIAEMSKDFDISATCLPHDMFRNGDRYRDDNGRVIGETKSDVFEHYGLNPIGVESGKGKVMMRYDKIHSACELKNPDGVYKFRISSACENLIDEMDNAVHDDVDPTALAHKCRDHAIDDFGLFLVYYSDDIEPLGFESLVKDNRGYLQRLLDEDEERLEAEEEDAYSIGVDNFFDM